MKINIYNEENKKLVTLNCFPKKDSLSIFKHQKNKVVASITGYDTRNEWKSAVIYLDPQQFPSKRLSIGFEGTGSHILWFIDRIQSVKKVSGIELTSVSFDKFLTGFGSIFITIAVTFFAFSTILTWAYYGETGIVYLLGKKSKLPYQIIFVSVIFFGALNQLDTIINFTDLIIGLLVIPNVLSILILSPKVKQWSSLYLNKLKSNSFQESQINRKV